ncbi:MAG: DUF1559 domain-containing protein [Planctomycetales bacterium]|nr:DUF1559 domain-containing protein [Planctomycetales bacterium]
MTVRCPVCGRTVTVPAAAEDLPERKPAKGLWQVMGRAGMMPHEDQGAESLAPTRPLDPPVDDSPATELPLIATTPRVPVETPSESPPVRRGLWNLMGRREADDDPVVRGSPDPKLTAGLPERGDLRSDSVARSRDRATTESGDRTTTGVLDEALDESVDAAPDEPIEELAIREPLQPQTLGLEDFVGGVRGTRRATPGGWGIISFSLGLLALPLAVPALYASSPLVFVPSGVLGFVAICFGLSTINAIRRGRAMAKGRGFAWAGMLAGMLAMFLGPVVFSGIGKRMAEESRDNFTKGHLRHIGEGLQAFHNAHGMFPPGGVFRPVAGGTEQGMHGWMTLLLPHLGELELYNRIDLQKPFSDEANLPAMGTDLPMFLAAGADRSKVAGKFGVAHFAGVGGEFVNEDGEQVEAGIFETNSEITRDLVTDGLSNTLVAGEVPAPFPAWGDPENWRQVGRGLNQDPDGFGNVEGTGAMFLMADGSVRFISRRTSRRVLEALSTRSSGDQ